MLLYISCWSGQEREERRRGGILTEGSRKGEEWVGFYYNIVWVFFFFFLLNVKALPVAQCM